MERCRRDTVSFNSASASVRTVQAPVFHLGGYETGTQWARERRSLFPRELSLPISGTPASPALARILGRNKRGSHGCLDSG